ncbi:hypothetical protein N2152v2_005261 [Parachlorella kessleri]
MFLSYSSSLQQQNQHSLWAQFRLTNHCRWLQGTVLYLCEKQLRVEIARFIDESLEDPLVKEAKDRWLCGTEAIWDYIEEHHKDAPDLGRPVPELSDGVVLGQLAPGMFKDRIFCLLSDALTSKDDARQQAALEDLEALLRQLDDWLAERELPFIGGDAPDATDCYLVPKLNHAVLALSKLQGWQLPEDLQALHKYLVLWRERASWKESCFDESIALGFWRQKRESSQG